MNTTKPAVNIFAAAAAKPATKTAKKEKEIVELPELGDKIGRYEEIKAALANLEAEGKMLEGEIKDMGRTAWMQKYTQERKRPESFRLQDATGATTLLLVIDKYTKVEDEKRAVLETIDPDLIEVSTQYSFNPDILQKHQEAIAEAIAGMDIPDEDKAAMLVVSQTKAIRKGTIDRLAQYDNPGVVFDLISPIVQLKTK
jgi:hypothetical protein